MTIVSVDNHPYASRRKFDYTDYGIPSGKIEDITLFQQYAGSRTRQKVSGFRDKIARGLGAVGPYTADVTRVLTDRVGFAHHQLSYTAFNFPFLRTRTETWTGQYGGLPSVAHLPTSGSNADSKALSKVLSRIRENSGSATGLISLGELRETIRMLKHPFESSLRLLSDYAGHCERLAANPKHRNKSERKRWRNQVSGAVSDAWLETTFGLIPLISDVEQIATAIARWNHDSNRSTVRARGKWSTQRFIEIPPTRKSMLESYGTNRQTTEHSVQYICGLNTESAAFGSAERLMDLLGFRLDEFAPTLWELTPWSFLVDYVSNVGDIINAVSTDTSSVRWISKTDRLVSEVTQQCDVRQSLSSGYSSNQFINTGSLFKVRKTTLIRTAPAVLGWPSLQWEGIPTAFVKTGNILALLNARFTSAQRKFR